ncbi:MAG TPA: C4-type zinc ribbon domain-containing protein [Syntrophales bacterium]|nr:C4-type zinc ribbon domain-containing protein [Syntrophales bacterium]HPQ45519.1 C4-type zinc ribbon domain-containing protein [Syntrophales bacterium]
MKEQILFLVELQNITAEINELKRREVDLPKEIDRVEDELKTIEQQLEEHKQRLETLKTEHKAKETVLKNSIDSARKARGRLLDVKTNKEYEATLKEIDTINEKSSNIEDEIILILEEIDRAGTGLKGKENEAADKRSVCETNLKRIREEQGSIGSTLENIMQKRDTVRSKIKDNLLRKFDIIQNRKHGLAVVSVWKEICSGCHMNIPPQLYNELQKNNELIVCPNCERIIYWEDRSIEA